MEQVPGKSRGWIITINNYTMNEVNLLREMDVEYAVVGFENAPTTGTPHLHAYLYFKNARCFGPLKKKFPRANIEAQKGSFEQCFNYVTEDGNFFEIGEPPKQGKRTDLDTVREMVKKGVTKKELFDNCTSFQALKFGMEGRKIYAKRRMWKPLVTWIWGPTGVGKTKRAFEMHPDAWVSGRDLEWWEGYSGDESIILDDFRPSFCKFAELLRILDRYPYTVMVKGSSEPLLARNIVITSCYSPEQMYDTEEDIQQLLRRIDIVIHMTGDQK